MKSTVCLLFLGLTAAPGLAQKTSNAQMKKDGGFSAADQIKILPVDYTKAPVYREIAAKGQLKPAYQYMDSVNVESIGTYFDSLFLDGFMVSPKAEGKFPVIIYCRGGNATMGPMKIAEAVQILAPIAAKGYVVIAMNHRGVDGCEGLDDFGGSDYRDILNLVQHLSEVNKADTSKLGIFGNSRGGMSAYTTLAQSCAFKAAVVSGGIADAEENYTNPDHPMKEVYEKLIPGFAQNKTGELQKRSAVRWAEKLCKSTPLLMLHGTRDKNVKVSGAERLDAELCKISFPHKFIRYKDNHGLQQHRAEAFFEMMSWYRIHLK